MCEIKLRNKQLVNSLNSSPLEVLTDMIICFTSLVSSIQSNAASKTKWEYWPCNNGKIEKVKRHSIKAHKTVQCVKALAARPDRLSSIPRTYIMEGKYQCL